MQIISYSMSFLDIVADNRPLVKGITCLLAL